MEPEGSLPCSQQPATGLYPDPDENFQHLPTLFPQDPSNIIFPSVVRSSEWPLPFSYSDKNTVCTSHLSRACYMRHPFDLLSVL